MRIFLSRGLSIFNDNDYHFRMTTQTSPTPTQQAPALAPTVVEASVLMGKHSEIAIRHRGEIYRLRVTRNGKLILTK